MGGLLRCRRGAAQGAARAYRFLFRIVDLCPAICQPRDSTTGRSQGATLTEPAPPPELIDSFDVVVAGGGTAGMVAAVAASRNGARVLLTERAGFLGGTIATQLLEHSAGWFDAGGTQIVGGLPQELVD